MAERVYLTVAEVIAIHHNQIEEYGGAHGLRDQGSLEAAVFRPQTGYYNDVSEEAAALLESLVNNHAFVDGNKRVGFAAMHTFLLVNGFYSDVSSKAAYEFIIEAMEEGSSASLCFTNGSPRTSFPFRNKFRGLECPHSVANVHFGTISTNLLSGSPFIRLTVYV